MQKTFLFVLLLLSFISNAQYVRLRDNGVLINSNFYVTNSPTNMFDRSRNISIMKDSTLWRWNIENFVYNFHKLANNKGTPNSILWANDTGKFIRSSIDTIRLKQKTIIGLFDSLQNKYTKSQTDSKFSIVIQSVKDSVANKYKKSEIDNKILIINQTIIDTASHKYSKPIIDSKFSIVNQTIKDSVSNKYKKSEIDSKFLANTQVIKDSVANKYTKNQIDLKVNTLNQTIKDSVSNKYTKAQIDAFLNLYYTKIQSDARYLIVQTDHNNSRTLGGSAFQVSTTVDALVTYSGSVSCNLSLTGGQEGSILVQTSPDNVTFTTKGQIGGSNTGTLTIGLNTTQKSIGTITLRIPKNYYVKIISFNVTGSPTYILSTNQSEWY